MVELYERLGGEVLVNTTTADGQQAPSITALADGGYVVTWMSYNQDGSGYGVYAQRYGADGVAVGGEFRVNTTTASTQEQPSITTLPDGGFVVSWSPTRTGAATESTPSATEPTASPLAASTGSTRRRRKTSSTRRSRLCPMAGSW